MPLVVRGDAGRLQQIFWNLMSNAIKFSSAGASVQASAGLKAQMVTVEVTDTGQGIHPEFLPHVFESFRQEDQSKARVHGGLGLGLAIVKHLTEAHGGSVHVDSDGPGMGSRFTVALPAFTGVGDAVTPSEVRRPQLTGVRILVVDDDPDACELLARALGDLGGQVVTTSSAAEARAEIDLRKPDVIVSDIGMPGEDGHSMLRRIRQGADPHARTIPALAVSAYAREEDRIRSLSAGFQMHMAKPFEPVELTTAVSRLLHRDPAPSEAAPAPGGPKKPRPHVLVIEDSADVREGLRQLLEASGYLVEVAEDGLEGVARALERRPQIALVDLGLPGLDGYGVAERIRNQVPSDEIALVALTGRTHPDDVRRAAASGFDAYLTKPVSFEKLDTLISARLSLQNGSPASD
jgi:CheY-like chemotaxis protein